MTRQGRAYLYGLAAVLLWSTVATAFKLSLRRLAPVELLLYATACSTVVLFLILAGQGKVRLLLSYSPR